MTLPALLPALALFGAAAPQTAPAPGVATTITERPVVPATTEPADPLVDPATAPAVDAPPVAVTATKTPGDPLETFNRKMFARHQAFDRAILRPAALGYRQAVPKPGRDAIRNFFSNLGEPLVFLNFLLQAKFGKAAETLGRFVINTGLGFGGILDIAKLPGVALPHRSNGFGNTLALYGVGPGPYLFLPFVGPTTLRDLIGGQAEGFVPLAVGAPFDRLEYQIPRGVLIGLDRRAEADAELRALFDGAVDPYATLRSVYLQNRQGEIDALRGRPHAAAADAPELGEPLEDPAGTGPTPGDAPELSDPLADPAARPVPVP